MELTGYLKKHFGFDTFKGNQEAIIRNVLNQRDTFVLMPTEEENRFAINYRP
jgi:ATP-dependent DNA helicase RecQ